MIEDRDERLRLTLTGREFSIVLSEADEKRLRMWIDRFNQEIKDCPHLDSGDVMDPDSDRDLAVAFTTCMGDGLDADEAQHGLHAFPWGDVVTMEQATEIFKRRMGETNGR